MAPHSSILTWRIPWTEKPGSLQSMGLQESDTTQRLKPTNHHTLIHSSVDRHLGYFSVLAFVNSTAVNIGTVCLFRHNFLYSLLAVLGLHCRVSFSFVVVSRAMPQLGARAAQCSGFSCCGHWLQGLWAQQLRVSGLSIVAVHGLSRYEGPEILPDQGWKPRLLQRQADSSPLSQRESHVVSF